MNRLRRRLGEWAVTLLIVAAVLVYGYRHWELLTEPLLLILGDLS